MTDFVQLKLITFILMITTLIPVREFFRHIRPCAPIFNKFHRNSCIVWTHGTHPIIVSNSANMRLTFENVCLGYVKHNLWGNLHNVSVLNPTNSHTILHPKFVFVWLPLRPALARLQLFDKILDPLVDGVIHECMTKLDVPKGLF
jgi:hypothetical protein